MKITIVCEDTTENPALVAEHGLAIHIQSDDKAVLFDSGQSGKVLMKNAEALDISLSKLDAVILSHAHYDHTDGIPELLEKHGPPPRLVVHDRFFDRKFRHVLGPLWSYNGYDPKLKKAIDATSTNIQKVSEPTQVLPGVHVTGTVQRKHKYEVVTEKFFVEQDDGKKIKDKFLDDQSMYVETPGGTVIILGCTHSGIANTIDHIRGVTKNRPVKAIIGGMHLHNADQSRIKATVEKLKKVDPQILMPNHCTGQPAIEAIREVFDDRVLNGGAGATVEI